jgi:hypothetical protein
MTWWPLLANSWSLLHCLLGYSCTSALFAQARDKIAAEEADMAARIAYEVKTEFEREAAARAAAKQALVTFLAGNEEHKKVKEAEKERQRLEDLEYMRKYEEILDKQQKERLARLARLQEWQVRSDGSIAAAVQ